MKKREALTRRSAFLLAASPVALAAQTAPAPASVPDELEAAHKNRVRTAEQLKKIKLPMSVEPSFNFHA